MIKKILKNTAAQLGYEIQKKAPLRELGYDLEGEAGELIHRVQPYTMLSRERLVTLYQQVIHCERNAIEGDFVECGVWKGGAVALMALANLKSGSLRRNIHLFDAFTDSFGGPGSLEGNQDLLTKEMGYDSAFLHFHKGWFQETLPKDSSQISHIAILRLDGDWYASTRICLEFLYDKVVRGGFVIIDDYGTYEGCRKAVDEFRQKNKISDYLHHIDQPGRYWIKS
jgi:O-methyltransferase